MQAVETILHLGDPALSGRLPGFIGKCCPHNCDNNLMQVGQALDRIGEGLFIDVGIFRPDPVADRAVSDGGEFENS